MTSDNSPVIAIYSRSAYPAAKVIQNAPSYLGSGINTLIISGPNGYEGDEIEYKGSIVYNNLPFVMFDKDGSYAGDPDWSKTLSAFLTLSDISAVYLSLGDSAVTALGNMASKARANVMSWLKTNGFTGIDLDVETQDPTDANTQGVTRAAIKAGLKLTAAPYDPEVDWKGWCEFVTANDGTVEWLNLQCYDGGYGNNPSSWASSIPGVPIVAGIALETEPELFPGQYDPTAAAQQFSTLQSEMKDGTSLKGGFLWQYSFLYYHGCNFTLARYAQAMLDGLKQ
jgi:hypothetical protein